MPPIISHQGQQDRRSGGTVFMDSSDPVFGNSRKRSRGKAAFNQRKSAKVAVEKQQQQIVSFDSLPNECLYEILRRLRGDKERSISACVSKRWLMLLSSIRVSEISTSYLPTTQEACPRMKPLPDLNEEASAEEEKEPEVVMVETAADKGHLSRQLEGRSASDVRLSALAIGSSSRGGLGKLCIEGGSGCRVTDVGLSAIARGCPSLRDLSLWDLPRVTDLGLIEIANCCPLLENLNLYECPLISDKGLVFLSQKCPNLVSLTLDSCSGIGNAGLQAIGRGCGNLKFVSIKDCLLVGDKGIVGLVASAALLERIKLQKLSIGDFALAAIGYYGKNLVNLAITGLQDVTEKGFWVMGNTSGLQKLKFISILSCNGVTDVGLQAIAKGSPKLKQICVRKSCLLSDSGLKAFAEAAVALENLQLEECNRITLAGVIVALVNCSQKVKTLSLVKCVGVKDINFCPTSLRTCLSLKSLTIRGCPGFTGTNLAMVGKLCPQLVNLDLNGQVGITDGSLLRLIESSRAKLAKVDLGGCYLLTDKVAIAISKAHGTTLEMLNLDGCKNITDKSILAISEYCSVLVELDISRSRVTDYGVAVLASARKLNLQILSLGSCSKLTPKCVPLLGNMGRSMTGLNLQQCNAITSEGVEFLEEKLWWCDILS